MLEGLRARCQSRRHKEHAPCSCSLTILVSPSRSKLSLLRSLMKSSSRYRTDQLPLLADRCPPRSRLKRTEIRRSRLAIMALLTLVTLTYLCYAYAALHPLQSRSALHDFPSVPSLDVPHNIQRSWSMYSPYFAAGRYEAPPDGCLVDQVCASYMWSSGIYPEQC